MALSSIEIHIDSIRQGAPQPTKEASVDSPLPYRSAEITRKDEMPRLNPQTENISLAVNDSSPTLASQQQLKSIMLPKKTTSAELEDGEVIRRPPKTFQSIASIAVVKKVIIICILEWNMHCSNTL